MPKIDALELALREMWKDARNCGCARVSGAIELAFSIGLLSADQRELWERRVLTCPGHDDEGGRDWCAYCGDIPK